MKNDKKELAYYLTIYTLEGHTTWRCYLGPSKDSFEKQIINNKEGVHPKVLKKNVLKIDRLTGQIIPL